MLSILNDPTIAIVGDVAYTTALPFSAIRGSCRRTYALGAREYPVSEARMNREQERRFR